MLEYQDVMRRLVHRLLPVYARALDLPADYFTPFFHKGGEITVRMIHYPPATPEQVADDVFGTAAHTDRNMLTILAQGDTPGLQIMLPDGTWIPAPILPGAFVVNSGDTLRRWSNDRFLSTPHRVLNISGPRPLFGAVFCLARIRHRARMPAELPGPGQPGEIPAGDDGRVHDRVPQPQLREPQPAGAVVDRAGLKAV